MVVTASHNGGRSQVNLNYLQIGGAYSFLNCLKTAQNWTFVDNTSHPLPTTLDSDGYPTSISNGGVFTVFYVPTQAVRPGNYAVTWDGNGTIRLNMSNTLVDGNKTSTTGSGRYVFSTTAFRFDVGISSIGSPRITNMKVFHVDDETAINAGEVFGTKFKERLVEGGFGVVRFLNWQKGNGTNVTIWATRLPTTYVFYSGSEYRSAIYAGTTTNVGNAYSVAAPSSWSGLVDKAMVQVSFNADATQSGGCTLNVGGTGGINILSAYCGALGASSYPLSAIHTNKATLVYDATLNAWIKQGADAAEGSIGINNGVPPELMVQLCAEIGAHPYFVTPPLAIDPATDYMTSLATYCRDNGPAWMVPRFEGPNELWNTAAGFNQTGYANAKATTYGWGADYHNWYGKAVSVLGQAVSVVYSNNRTRYQVICGVQTGLGTDTTSSNPRLASTKYLLQSPQSGYTATAASGWVTHVCCAQYFAPSARGTGAETTLAVAFAGGDTTAPATYIDTVNSGSGNFTLPALLTLHQNWKTWAQGFGISKLCGYEGGYSSDYASLGNSDIDRLRAAAKAVTTSPGHALGLHGYLSGLYDSLMTLNGGGFTFEFPSCFQFSGNPNINGYSTDVWSILEDIYQTNTPQFEAIRLFNVNKRRCRITT